MPFLLRDPRYAVPMKIALHSDEMTSWLLHTVAVTAFNIAL